MNRLNKWFWEGFTLILAFMFLFFGWGFHYVPYFIFAGMFAGFFLCLLAYRRMKLYIIDEATRMLFNEEYDQLQEFLKGLE